MSKKGISVILLSFLIITTVSADFNQLCRDGSYSEIKIALSGSPDLTALAPLRYNDSLTFYASPLVFAAYGNDDPAVFKLLIEAGADVNDTVVNGRTVLIIASLWSDNPDVIKTLIDAGADVNTTDANGYNALHWAVAANPEPSVTKALIAGGANLGQKDNWGLTPLHRAAKNAAQNTGNLRITDILLNAGADLETRDVNGYTPLHWAAESNTDTETIKSIVQAGADLNAITYFNDTPLSLAANRNKNYSSELGLLLEPTVPADSGDILIADPVDDTLAYPVEVDAAEVVPGVSADTFRNLSIGDNISEIGGFLSSIGYTSSGDNQYTAPVQDENNPLPLSFSVSMENDIPLLFSMMFGSVEARDDFYKKFSTFGFSLFSIDGVDAYSRNSDDFQEQLFIDSEIDIDRGASFLFIRRAEIF